jgi:EpsI family protein
MARRGVDAGSGSGMSTARAAIAVVLLASAAVATRIGPAGTPAGNAALDSLPYTIGAWKGADAQPPDADDDTDTEQPLDADAILNRTYTPASEAEPQSRADAVGLYIAYYREQRPGAGVHSPLHCLPGTGWEPEDARTIDIAGAGTNSRMKRLIVRKNLNRAIVLYAYRVHGRLVANELLSKFWLVNDRIRGGRGDAALVRIVAPVTQTIEAAEERGLAFTRDFLPYIFELWS